MTYNSNLYNRNSCPRGKPWHRWIELWWKWCYREPSENSPVLDKTGKSCNKNQIHDTAWFLAGTFGGSVKRKCTIPFGRSIFFPVVNDLISFAEYPQLKTERQLHEYAKRDLDTTSSLSVKIDGVSVQRLWDFRIHSELFEIEIPQSRNNEKTTRTHAVSDGYWIFIKTLPRGRHVLSFIGEKQAFDQIKSDMSEVSKTMFTVGVVYHLLVF